MYGKSICENPKRYIWNRDTTTTCMYIILTPRRVVNFFF